MRLIDAGALTKKLNIFNDRIHGNKHFLNGIESAKEIVENEPTVDAEPVRHGKWILRTCMPHENYCSECRRDSPYNIRWDYCPNCGARMDEDDG